MANSKRQPPTGASRKCLRSKSTDTKEVTEYQSKNPLAEGGFLLLNGEDENAEGTQFLSKEL